MLLRLRVSPALGRGLEKYVLPRKCVTFCASDLRLYGGNTLSARKNAQVRAFAVESLA